ncbi:MAG TPA: DUF2232 domain-containing protein [Bacteriovoracaceae bacterium]|nr:DUF2232 domain-containing protein [Bacteriovoracaceae bacterium]
MSTELMQAPQLSTARLLLLGVASVVLCLSFVMSVFAPFPLAMAIILYGRSKGYLTGLLGLGLSFAFALLVYKDLTLFGFYVCIFIFGVSIAEICLRNLKPIKSIVTVGMVFLTLIFGGFFAMIKTQDLTVRGYIVDKIQQSEEWFSAQKEIFEKSPDSGAIQVLELLNNPVKLAEEVIKTFPSTIFIGVFLILWFNTFLILKSRRLLQSGEDFTYSEKSLLHFKVPFGFVGLAIIGLVLAVWGSQLGSPDYETLGFTIVKCLGLFYFFQGFGIFNELLNFVGMRGFFRTLIVIFVIFSANYLIAGIGLFDNWFDFRKYLKKRNK